MCVYVFFVLKTRKAFGVMHNITDDTNLNRATVVLA
jgi:hypothetical protein